MYNVNELGPENVFSGGAVTRSSNPVTIDGRTGYVEPDIQGRAIGGFMGNPPDSPYPWFPGNQTIPSPEQPQPPTAPQAPPVNPDTGYPNENPGGVEGGYNFMTEPGYQFRFEEGMRALDRGAAARGGLLSGGYARKAIRYGQGFASNEYANVYNRIAKMQPCMGVQEWVLLHPTLRMLRLTDRLVLAMRGLTPGTRLPNCRGMMQLPLGATGEVVAVAVAVAAVAALGRTSLNFLRTNHASL
jgi:hypothetical protein